MYPSINILILDIKISQNIRQCYYLHTNEECISSINKQNRLCTDPTYEYNSTYLFPHSIFGREYKL